MGYVLDFAEGDGAMRDLLGGKGAGLAEMTKLGLAVPPGFTITTDACRYVMEHKEVPPGLWEEVEKAVGRLEERTGRSFGGGPVPLLVSVRSGAKFSMPGMMDTILNLGVNEEVVDLLGKWAGDQHFAHDAYRRFVQMYGEVVEGVPDHAFEEVLSDLRASRRVTDDSELTSHDLAQAGRRFHQIVLNHARRPVPVDPREQLQAAITAVLSSWGNKRAREYRRLNGIPDDLGTAATVQMMVFGDLGEDSGTGVCFTRNPNDGAKQPYGSYLAQAQGEDVVAGVRNTATLDDLAGIHPDGHAQLLAVMGDLELHFKDMCDIEFTIEKGELFILQTRPGKRVVAAAVKIAVDLVGRGSHRPPDRDWPDRPGRVGATRSKEDRPSPGRQADRQRVGGEPWLSGGQSRVQPRSRSTNGRRRRGGDPRPPRDQARRYPRDGSSRRHSHCARQWRKSRRRRRPRHGQSRRWLGPPGS